MYDNEAKMKVAFVVDKYRRGGVAVVLQVLLQFLVQEGKYDLTLFVRDFDPKEMRPVPEGVVCRPWPEQLTIKNAFRKSFREGTDVLWHSFMTVKHFRNFGKRGISRARCRDQFPGVFDCAIAYHMIPNDVTTVVLEKICAKRKILWLHLKKNFREKDLPFYDDFYSRADAIVCVSKDTEINFRRLMPKCADKVLTIHNMYNTTEIRNKALGVAEELEQNPGTIKLVTAARLNKEKGYERVPGVARKLKDAGYDFHWYIVGDGDLYMEIEEALQRDGVTDRVHLLGHRDNPYPYIQQCDIYVQTSHMEGFCTSTMEAKILYKPVVTTDVQGMREQFADGKNGLIVESSVDGIFKGIKKMIDSPQLREQIVERLRTEAPHNERVLAQTRNMIAGTDL